jgi:hypothetical protein
MRVQHAPRPRPASMWDRIDASRLATERADAARQARLRRDDNSRTRYLTVADPILATAYIKAGYPVTIFRTDTGEIRYHVAAWGPPRPPKLKREPRERKPRARKAEASTPAPTPVEMYVDPREADERRAKLRAALRADAEAGLLDPMRGFTG